MFNLLQTKPKTHIKIAYHSKSTISNIKFLGNYNKDTINWKYRIEYILPKLSAVFYAVRIIKPHMYLATLKVIYYSNFDAIIDYGLPYFANLCVGAFCQFISGPTGISISR